MKLMQEIRAFAEVTNRQPALSARSAAWTMNRPPILHAIPPRIRRSIAISVAEPNDVPSPVKILHVSGASHTSA
jgi:hypothetical protein